MAFRRSLRWQWVLIFFTQAVKHIRLGFVDIAFSNAVELVLVLCKKRETNI